MSVPAESSHPEHGAPGVATQRRSDIRIVDLGRMSYAAAYQVQLAHHEEVLAARETGTPDPGRLLLVEHDPPVITISRRANWRQNLLASDAVLARSGVTVAETDRGGDITYHGPAQLVVYPILDLNLYHLGLHAYMRLLEQAVIDAIATWGIRGEREAGATGVWVVGGKIAAMGVRVRRWVSMHGLALNVAPDLGHFDLIVPCGLAGRSVTSVERELAGRGGGAGGGGGPSMDEVKGVVSERLIGLLERARIGTGGAGEPRGMLSP